jgi:hypothetical protein
MTDNAIASRSLPVSRPPSSKALTTQAANASATQIGLSDYAIQRDTGPVSYVSGGSRQKDGVVVDIPLHVSMLRMGLRVSNDRGGVIS